MPLLLSNKTVNLLSMLKYYVTCFKFLKDKSKIIWIDAYVALELDFFFVVVVIHLPSVDLFMIKIELVGFLYSKEEQSGGTVDWSFMLCTLRVV